MITTSNRIIHDGFGVEYRELSKKVVSFEVLKSDSKLKTLARRAMLEGRREEILKRRLRFLDIVEYFQGHGLLTPQQVQYWKTRLQSLVGPIENWTPDTPPQKHPPSVRESLWVDFAQWNKTEGGAGWENFAAGMEDCHYLPGDMVMLHDVATHRMKLVKFSKLGKATIHHVS